MRYFVKDRVGNSTSQKIKLLLEKIFPEKQWEVFALGFEEGYLTYEVWCVDGVYQIDGTDELAISEDEYDILIF